MTAVETHLDMYKKLCTDIVDDSLRNYMRININEEDFKDIQDAIKDVLHEDIFGYGTTVQEILKELIDAVKFVVEDIGFYIFEQNLYNRDFPLLPLEDDESYLENVQRSMVDAVCKDVHYSFTQNIKNITGENPVDNSMYQIENIDDNLFF